MNKKTNLNKCEWVYKQECKYEYSHVYLYDVPRADIVHVLHMQSADLRPRADTLEVRRWF